ncbi:MAG TPA: cyclodeaminase/cyclohydrolase family protein [Candidatus Saccharimonadales bacterium]|nr:cyclodeaminase/cyclohydrolase family protein [Candidatus Saccharimonadales bacterium]
MDNIKVTDWLDNLAAKTPAPGGGAVAALAAAVAAAQLGMVAVYTTGPKWQDREVQMQELNEQLALLRTEALALVQADTEAFAKVGAAYQLPKTSDVETAARSAAIQKALAAAAEPPVQTAKVAELLVEIAAKLAHAGNPNVISDVAVGAALARSALEAAIVNIEINERELVDAAAKHSLQSAAQHANEIILKAQEVIKTVRKQIGNV